MFFLESRPDGLSEFQRDIYKNEDAFMARLHKLQKTILKTERGREIYKNALKEYYIDRNLPQKDRDEMRQKQRQTHGLPLFLSQ